MAENHAALLVASGGASALSSGLAVCYGYGTAPLSSHLLRLRQQNCFHLTLKRSKSGR